MKQFINPVDILDLAATDITAIDDTTIKRARKAALAEIDLSDDGMLDYNGHKLTRTDCERVIEELEDREKLEFYHFIAGNSLLTSFLVKGDETFLTSFKYESIYQLPAFVNFISPYFADAYNLAIWKAWQRHDGAISKYTDQPILLAAADLDAAYVTLRGALTNQVNEVVDLTRKLKESDKTQAVVTASVETAARLMETDQLNALPPYFQQLRNYMGEAVRQLSIEMVNSGASTECGYKLNELAMELKTDGVFREAIVRDNREIQEVQGQQKLADSNDLGVQKYLELFRTFPQILKAAENSATSVDGLRIWVSENIDIALVNAAGEHYGPVRTRVSIFLRNLGVTVWNNHGNAETAIHFIDLALRLEGLEQENIWDIQAAKSQIQRHELIRTEADEAAEKKKKSDEAINVISIIVGIAFAIFLMSARGCR